MLILTTLLPFFIVGSLVLLAFTIAYRISDADCRTVGEDSLSECYLSTIQMFFSGSDETESVLDIIFGVVAIVILLNVVIAIVGDVWQVATEEASELYWTFRVGYLLETRVFGLFQKKVSRNRNLVCFTGLTDLIDHMEDIRLIDKAIWEEVCMYRVLFKGVSNISCCLIITDIGSFLFCSVKGELRFCRNEESVHAPRVIFHSRHCKGN